MMVRGEKAEVLKYLRTLPLEERGVMRRKLLQGLEVIQSRRNSEASSGSESNNETEVKRKPSLSSADAAEVRNPILPSSCYALWMRWLDLSRRKLEIAPLFSF